MPEPQADAATSTAALSDGCDAELLAMEEGEHMLATEGLADSMSAFEACGAIAALPSADGFFLLHASAGERLHVVATPTDPAQNVALYYLAACAPESCARVQERCGAGVAEHATFLAPTAGDWIVGVESDLALEVGVLVARPRCGDGVASPGETCDDGNIDAADGCDAACRAVLDRVEVEPNDDRARANFIPALELPIGSALIDGVVEGCDADRFAIALPAGARIQVKVLDSNGTTCGELQWPIRLELFGDDEPSAPLGTGLPDRTAGACPSIELDDPFATITESGQYHLVITAPEGGYRAYKLFVEVTAP